MMGRYLRVEWFICCAILCCGGCSKPTGDISGTVQWEGQPLIQGRIAFHCQGGDKPVLMTNVRSGEFAIQAAPLGRCQVTVETFEQKTTRVPGQINSPTPDDVPLPEDEASPVIDASYVPLPSRYASPEKSGLEFEVAPGPNTFDIELER